MNDKLYSVIKSTDLNQEHLEILKSDKKNQSLCSKRRLHYLLQNKRLLLPF